MKGAKKAWCRLYQKTLYVGMAFMPWRKPVVIAGNGSFADVAQQFVSRGLRRPLVVCDQAAIDRGALNPFFDGAKGKLDYALFSGVLPNPTVGQVEQGLAIYHANNCDSILAFGGGSAMDCAKIIGARVVKPKKSVNQMKGIMKVGKKLPPLFAVPTTAGTGSECTIAAVITDPDRQDKYAISDFCLIPHYAVLDATLTVGLPPFLTATTGMDALTHAVEAYVGKSNTKATKQQAEQAVQLIFENIKEATNNGTNLLARANMQQAAYLAGLAFTRAYVGYVHAMAHSLGGKYGIAHGLANAVLLPHVLQAFGDSAHKKLAKLAVLVGVATAEEEASVAANRFIDAIFDLNQQLGIPSTFQGKIDVADLEELANHADKEANPLYPVPKLMDAANFVQIYKKVL